MPRPSVGDIIRLSDLLPLFDLLDNNTSKGYIGQIIAFYGTTPPPHTLLCDGSEISRETYYELFNVIGTSEGEGDGATTFNLPDLRDRWIKYSGTENNVGEKIAEGLPNIHGTLQTGHSLALFTQKVGTGAFRVDTSLPDGSIRGTTGTYYKGFIFNASLSNSIYGASTHVTPKSVALLPCIIYE